jgi:aspartyl-tRNA synthetase
MLFAYPNARAFGFLADSLHIATDPHLDLTFSFDRLAENLHTKFAGIL